MKFIHITDPHLIGPGQKLHGTDPLERLQDCLTHVFEFHGDAAFCVITGDLADRGQPQAYQALHKTLKSFPLKTHLLIGNHDDRVGFTAIFPNKRRDDDGFIQSAITLGNNEFIFLDTLDQGKHAGYFCESRQAWLKKRLAAASNRDIYLFMHHPPFTIGIPALDSISLANPQEFKRVIVDSSIKYLFFGHVHRPVNGVWEGIPFSTLFATNHQAALSFQPDEVIWYSRESPAYAVVMLEQNRVIIHHCNYLNDTSWRPDSRPPQPD